MSLSITPAKLFKSGKFMMTAAATIAVVASATATTLTSVNADDSAAPAKVTTSQKVEPSENHTYKGHVFDAPIRVETHDIWTANSESVIADNMSKQGIKSVDQLGDYKVVWGDTLSTIAAHFHVSTDELAQRFGIADVNYIAAGITMKNQANINELESQVVHDAQWNGEYNAKVAASQASDAAQSTGASDVANAQTNATATTPDATPIVQAPVANTDVPDQAAQSSDTHVGGASDVINNIADGAKTNQTPVVTPADKPEAETPKTDAPAPTTNTDKGADTNIGNASDVIKGVDDGKDTPAAQPAPVEAQKPEADADQAAADKAAADKAAADKAAADKAAAEKAAADKAAADKAAADKAAADQAAADKAAADQAAADKAAADQAAADQAAADQAAADKAAADKAAAEKAAADKAAADKAAADKAAADQAAADKAAADKAAAEKAAADKAAAEKAAADASTSNQVPANPVDGSTFFAMHPASNGSFGLAYGTLTYHTSFSGISVSDLTHGDHQGLWLDPSGNALDPDYPVRIFYTKQDIDNLVTRYIDEQTPIEGTEVEGPDGLVGTTYHTAFSGYSVSDLTNGKYQGLSLDTSGNALDPDYPVRILYTKQDINNLVTRYIDELLGSAYTPVAQPATDAPAPDTNTDKGNDTNIGNASNVMNSIG